MREIKVTKNGLDKPFYLYLPDNYLQVNKLQTILPEFNGLKYVQNQRTIYLEPINGIINLPVTVDEFEITICKL